MSAEKKIITKGRLAVLIVIAILLIDQAIKIWVKTSMTLHESIQITNWFYITFIENIGMAFGMQLGSKIGMEMRGLWETENDYMGGPFYHFSYVNAQNKCISVDGFVYAPNDTKRDYLRQVEAIVKSVK